MNLSVVEVTGIHQGEWPDQQTYVTLKIRYPEVQVKQGVRMPLKDWTSLIGRGARIGAVYVINEYPGG